MLLFVRTCNYQAIECYIVNTILLFKLDKKKWATSIENK